MDTPPAPPPQMQLQVNSVHWEGGRGEQGTTVRTAGQRPAGEEGLYNRFGRSLYLGQRIKIGNGDKANIWICCE